MSEAQQSMNASAAIDGTESDSSDETHSSEENKATDDSHEQDLTATKKQQDDILPEAHGLSQAASASAAALSETADD